MSKGAKTQDTEEKSGCIATAFQTYLWILIFISLPYYAVTWGMEAFPHWMLWGENLGRGVITNLGRPGLYVADDFTIYLAEEGGDDDGYSGELVMDGQIYPVSAWDDGWRSVTGYYDVNGTEYRFTLSKNILAGLEGAVLNRNDIEIEMFMVKPTDGSSSADLGRYADADWYATDGELKVRRTGEGSLDAIYRPKSGGKIVYRITPEGDRIRGYAEYQGEQYPLEGLYDWQSDKMTLNTVGNTYVFSASRDAERNEDFQVVGVDGPPKRAITARYSAYNGSFVMDAYNDVTFKIYGYPEFESDADSNEFGSPICDGAIGSEWIQTGYDSNYGRTTTGPDDFLRCHARDDGGLMIEFKQTMAYSDRGIRYEIDQAVFYEHPDGLYNAANGRVYRRSGIVPGEGVYNSQSGRTHVALTERVDNTWYGLVYDYQGFRHHFAARMYGNSLKAVFPYNNNGETAEGMFWLEFKDGAINMFTSSGGIFEIEEGDYWYGPSD